MKHELAIARRIQLASLPQKTPVVKDSKSPAPRFRRWRSGGLFRLSEREHGPSDRRRRGREREGDIGGPLHVESPGDTPLLHGFGLSPADLFIRANRLLCGDMEKSSFVTAVGAAFAPQEQSFVLARAGHLPLYHFLAAEKGSSRSPPGASGSVSTTRGCFPPRSKRRSCGTARGRHAVRHRRRDRGAHRAGDLFGEDRLVDILSGRAGENAAAIRDAIIGELAAFSNGAVQHDDETIVVIKGL